MKISFHYCSKVLPAILLSGGLWTSIQLQAQFAPPAGMPGTTAIFADSAVFVDWASTCSFQAGWMDISNESLGVVTYGTPENGIGKADDLVLSLGDGEWPPVYLPPLWPMVPAGILPFLKTPLMILSWNWLLWKLVPMVKILYVFRLPH